MGAIQQALLAAGAVASNYRIRLLFPGADASTVFTDETGRAWTAFGNAQIDTSLGDQRGQFDGTGDYIETAHNTNLHFNTSQNFRITLDLRYSSLSGFQTLFSKGYRANVAGLILVQTGNGNGRPILYIHSGTLQTIIQDTTTTYAINTDYRVIIERISGTVSMTVNGSSVATPVANSMLISNLDNLTVGAGSVAGTANGFNGRFKEVAYEIW